MRLEFRIPMTKSIISGTLAIALLAAWPHAQQPTAAARPTAAERDREHASAGEGGAAAPRPARIHRAVDRCRNGERRRKRSAQVLWDDLNFEREFAFIPRDDVWRRFRKATSFTDVRVRSLARVERRRP